MAHRQRPPRHTHQAKKTPVDIPGKHGHSKIESVEINERTASDGTASDGNLLSQQERKLVSSPDRWSPGQTSVLLVDKCPDRWSSPVSSKKMPNPKCILNHSLHHTPNSTGPSTILSTRTSTTEPWSTVTSEEGSWDSLSTTTSPTFVDPTVLPPTKLSQIKINPAFHALYVHKHGSPEKSSASAAGSKRCHKRRSSSPGTISYQQQRCDTEKKRHERSFPRSTSAPRSRKNCHQRVEAVESQKLRSRRNSMPIPSREDLTERRSRAKELEETLLNVFREGTMPIRDPEIPPPPPASSRRHSISSHTRRAIGRKAPGHLPAMMKIDGHFIQSPLRMRKHAHFLHPAPVTPTGGLHKETIPAEMFSVCPNDKIPSPVIFPLLKSNPYDSPKVTRKRYSISSSLFQHRGPVLLPEPLNRASSVTGIGKPPLLGD